MLPRLHWNRGLGGAGGRKSQLGVGGWVVWGLGHFICPPLLKRMSPSFLATQASVSPAIYWRLGAPPPRSPASGARITLPPPSVSPSVPPGWVPPIPHPQPGGLAAVPVLRLGCPVCPLGWGIAARSPGSGSCVASAPAPRVRPPGSAPARLWAPVTSCSAPRRPCRAAATTQTEPWLRWRTRRAARRRRRRRWEAPQAGGGRCERGGAGGPCLLGLQHPLPSTLPSCLAAAPGRPAPFP